MEEFNSGFLTPVTYYLIESLSLCLTPQTLQFMLCSESKEYLLENHIYSFHFNYQKIDIQQKDLQPVIMRGNFEDNTKIKRCYKVLSISREDVGVVLDSQLSS